MRRYGCNVVLVAGVAFFAAVMTPDVALAQPAIAPPAPPVIGPLQYGPPGYPPTIGVPLFPPARAGVGVSADSLSPVPAPPVDSSPSGIAGVKVTDDSITAQYQPH